MEERRIIEVNDDWDTCSGDAVLVDSYVGVRCWKWLATDGIVSLRSVGFTSCWPRDRDYTAVCRCTPRVLTHFGHTCGIYAWYWHDPTPARPEPFSGEWIWGEVALWGDVNVHEKGIRASRARVTGFFVSPMTHRISNMHAELAASQWHVPTIMGGQSALVVT